MPDTQYYTAELYGATNAFFTAQTDWIKNNLEDQNIVYVAHVGDITHHGDTYTSQWTNATTAMYALAKNGF